MHQKGLGQKSKQNLHGNCQKKKKHSSWYTTAKRKRQHCWQTQVKARERQNDNGKFKDQPKWMEKKKASYYGIPTGVSERQSFNPFQDSQFTALCWCCPDIKPQGHWFPLVQVSDLASMALQMRREDRETMGQIHSASHQLGYRAQQSSNMGSNYSFLSFLPLSPSIVFSFFVNEVPGGTAGSVKCHTCDVMGGSQPPIMRRVRCPRLSMCEWCVWALTRQWRLTGDAADQPTGMPFICLNTASQDHLSRLRTSKLSGCLCRYVYRDEQLNAGTAEDLCPSGVAAGGQGA